MQLLKVMKSVLAGVEDVLSQLGKVSGVLASSSQTFSSSLLRLLSEWGGLPLSLLCLG